MLRGVVLAQRRDTASRSIMKRSASEMMRTKNADGILRCWSSAPPPWKLARTLWYSSAIYTLVDPHIEKTTSADAFSEEVLIAPAEREDSGSGNPVMAILRLERKEAVLVQES